MNNPFTKFEKMRTIAQTDVEGILDDIQDLRRYLILVEEHVTQYPLGEDYK